MKRTRICTDCQGRGIIQATLEVNNGDGTITASFHDVKCFRCKGTGIEHYEETRMDQLMELDAKQLGRLIAMNIPPHSCPKEVRELWYSFPPSMKADNYEKAWIQWLLSPAKGPLEQCR